MHPLRFWTAVIALAGAALAVVLVASTTHVTDVVVMAGFVVLTIAATHRETFFTDETAQNCVVVVATAAIVTFVETDSPLALAACCVAAGLHVDQIRKCAGSKLLVNSSIYVLSAFFAAVPYAIAVDGLGSSFATLVVAVVPTVLVYWLVNSAILSAVVGSFQGVRPVSMAWMLIRSETVMMVFAVAGAACGYLIAAVSQWIGFAALIGLLVVTDRLVIRSKSRPPNLRRRSLIGDLVQIGLGALALAMMIVLAFTEPAPALAQLAVLLGGVVAVLALTSRVGIVRSATGTTLVGLVAVYVAPPILTSTLVAVAGGMVLALRARTTFPRRSMWLAAVVFPASAVAVVKDSLPLRVEDDLLSILALAVAVSATAVIIGMTAVIIAVSARVGRLVRSVGVGYLLTDAWLFPAGIFVAIASAYSIVGGVVAAIVCVALIVFIERRRASISGSIAGSSDEDAASAQVRLAAVVAALHDRPGTPTHLNS